MDAINFIHNKYGILQGSAPKIEEIIKRIKNNKDANEDFLKFWLMIAVSTFLCPPTSLGISPRCYPSLVDVSRVKKLNWCQFVVDQLKVAAKKINTKNSIKGCILLLVIIYVDSLAIQNVQIPATMPRIAAWIRKLLDEVIKLDMNRDGSFGKLKKKRKICEAVRKVLGGVTEVLGTFIQELAFAKDGHPAGSSVRRSKRGRTVKHYEEEEDEEKEGDSEYEAEEEEDFCSSDEGCLGLDSKDEANHAAAPEDIPAMEENVPLSTRLKRMQSPLKEPINGHGTGSSGSTGGDDIVQDQKNTEPREDAPAPTVPNSISAPSASTVPAAQGDQGVKKLRSADIRQARLMLPQ
ncbi:hypothetical protein C2845_PM14G09700 [Panicum miliaceum]|uniref:Uncharacterized protein n=1 Tax=Panicum miliaceum TaxID=4540 RepID=A0A3L6PR37_PANMI|nr:hypothetical protein C2845_PM14G09700 [Panicum miliaceum]